MKTDDVSPEQIRQVVQEFARGLLEGAEMPPEFDGSEQAEDRDFALHMAEEAIIDLRKAIETDIYEGAADDRLRSAASLIIPAATRVAKKKGLKLEALAAPDRKMFLQGVARALVEERLKFIHRATDRLVPYAPSDPLFASASSSSLTFADAVSKYIATKTGQGWTTRTAEDNRRVLQLAAEHFGEAKPLGSLSKDDIRSFRDCLLTWRKKPPANAKLSDIAEAPPNQRIGARTARKYLGFVSAAFAFWVDEGFLDKDPVGRISIKVSKAQKAGKRRSFTTAELKAFFSSPLYTGCKSRLRRMTPGAEIIMDGYYWIPLVAALSGMRVTEIVQLAIADIEADSGGPVIRVRADPTLKQSLKSAASWRRVPVHRRLIELGFMDYVNQRREANDCPRLFADVTMSETGGAGGEFSKWFGRRMRDLGLKQSDLVFHSFRHAFIEALRAHSAPEYVVKAVVGHTSDDITSQYGAAPTTETVREWVDKVALLDALPAAN